MKNVLVALYTNLRKKFLLSNRQDDVNLVKCLSMFYKLLINYNETLIHSL